MATRGRGRRNAAWMAAGVLAVVAITVYLFDYFAEDEGNSTVDGADIGQLDEPVIHLPSGIKLPELSESTSAWGLDRARVAPARTDSMAAGVTLADLDRDGDMDLLAAHGDIRMFLWDGLRFVAAPSPAADVRDARGVTVADVDADGWPDTLISRSDGTDTVVWGGPWVEEGTAPDATTNLAGRGPSAGLLAAELSGDDAIDIARLSRDNGSPDVIWAGDPSDRRSFVSTPLGTEPRMSLAGEIADIDDDGLLDVWVTRDIGWEAGADSVYSRSGDPTGPWTDIAEELGVALEIDGMGLTLGDLNGDLSLDAYVSDLGDNEVLVRDGAAFGAVDGTGASRIRPPGAALDLISSSWASGVVDINLDGRLDLIVANGGFAGEGMTNKIPDTEVALDDPPAVLLGIGDGSFVDVWPEVDLEWSSASRGLTIGDVDGDGDDDLVFIGADGQLIALANEMSGAAVSVGPDSACDPSGAIVTVTQAGSSFMAPLRRHTYGGGHSPDLLVGTPDGAAEVKVAWPGGQTFTESLAGTTTPAVVVARCPE